MVTHYRFSSFFIGFLRSFNEALLSDIVRACNINCAAGCVAAFARGTKSNHVGNITWRSYFTHWQGCIYCVFTDSCDVVFRHRSAHPAWRNRIGQNVLMRIATGYTLGQGQQATLGGTICQVLRPITAMRWFGQLNINRGS